MRGFWGTFHFDPAELILHAPQKYQYVGSRLAVIQAKMGAKMGVKKPVLGALVWSVPMQLQPVLAYQTLANTIA